MRKKQPWFFFFEKAYVGWNQQLFFLGQSGSYCQKTLRTINNPSSSCNGPLPHSVVIHWNWLLHVKECSMKYYRIDLQLICIIILECKGIFLKLDRSFNPLEVEWIITTKLDEWSYNIWPDPATLICIQVASTTYICILPYILERFICKACISCIFSTPDCK